MSSSFQSRLIPRKIWLGAIIGVALVSAYFAVLTTPRAAAGESTIQSPNTASKTAISTPPAAAAPSLQTTLTPPSATPIPSTPAPITTAPVTTAHAPEPPLVTGDRQTAANAAVAYATSQGWASGIAVIDTQTGLTTTAGGATAMFPTESTMKVFIAANLLYTNQMSGSTQSTAYQMITESDDDDADALYSEVGGPSIEPTIAAHYAITDLGTEPTLGSGEWGSTQVTPLGMATFLVKAKADPAVGPWLIGAMTNMTPSADDGTNQYFGLKAADRTAAVKQGWGGDTVGYNSEGTPSIGYVDGGRYAIAIYTNHEPETSEATAAQIVTAQAKLLLPNGMLPAV